MRQGFCLHHTGPGLGAGVSGPHRDASRDIAAQCTVGQRITGHKQSKVAAILDSHYLSRDAALGVSAIRKLEAHEKRTKIPN